MNHTIKDAIVEHCHYNRHDSLRTHRHLLVGAYNHVAGLNLPRPHALQA